MAVSHALTVLRWQENLFDGEIPPEWMWPLDDQLEEWFEAVTRARKEKAGVDDDLEDAPDMMQNSLVAGRRPR